MKIDITPVAYVRQTRADKWKKRPEVLRYRAYATELHLKYKCELPEAVYLRFELEIPPSVKRSKKKYKARIGNSHKFKPDLDNLVKSVLDALCKDDSHVNKIYAEKVWADKGSITIKALEEICLTNF